MVVEFRKVREYFVICSCEINVWNLFMLYNQQCELAHLAVAI